MSVFKNEANDSWYTTFYYRTATGERKHKTKRGFKTQGEAAVWEHNFIQSCNETTDMTFEDFVKHYFEDIGPRLRMNTMLTKKSIISKYILPTFGGRILNDITGKDILRWQNRLTEADSATGNLSGTYLRTINSQLSAIFNHAVRYYGLSKNPMRSVAPIGDKNSGEMLFWTKDEYLRFSRETMNKPLSFYAFEMLYWCGIRVGELLALTPNDFDFDGNILNINKSFQRINKQDVITPPKTKKSVRKIVMPTFLSEEMKEYVNSIYHVQSDERIFPVTKSYLHYEIKRCSAASAVKPIRVHDLRHSHVSLLIDMGYSALSIADRMGHESIDITYRYAHLFPSVQNDMANSLNEARGDF